MWSDLSTAEIRALAPDALAAFDAVFAAADAARLPVSRLAQARITTLLTGEAVGNAAALSAGDDVIAEYAEQFVLDVSQITQAARSQVAAALGRDMFSFVQGVYVDDHGLRLRLVVPQLFGSDVFDPLTGPPVSDDSSDLWSALEAMMTAVVVLDELDPLTSELVRLRGARAHHCRVCTSRRMVTVVADHGSELLDQSDLADMTSLTAATKAALDLTDAILHSPAALPIDVVNEVRRHFSPVAALEIVLDVVRNASNKIAVALGADAATVTSGVEYFDVSALGEYSYGLAAPV